MNEELINETFIQKRTDEESIDIDIKFNLGRLNINPFSDTENIYRLNATYPNENYTPIIKYTEGKNGKLRLESQKVGSTITTAFSIDKVLDMFSKQKRDETITSSSNTWKLNLPKNLPMELNIKGGASEQNLELGGLSLSYFKLTTGASLTDIRFSEPNKKKLTMKIEAGAASFEARGLGNAHIDELKFDGGVGKSLINFSGELKDNAIVEISGGLGIIVLEIPKDTSTIIGAKDSRLMSIDMLPESFKRKGDIYINGAYEEDKPYLNININVALGSLKIIEI